MKHEKLKVSSVKNLPDKQYLPGRYILLHKQVYIYCPGKYYESKLSNAFFEKHLKVRATTRNWKTVLKLSELTLNEKPVK